MSGYYKEFILVLFLWTQGISTAEHTTNANSIYESSGDEYTYTVASNGTLSTPKTTKKSGPAIIVDESGSPAAKANHKTAIIVLAVCGVIIAIALVLLLYSVCKRRDRPRNSSATENEDVLLKRRTSDEAAAQEQSFA